MILYSSGTLGPCLFFPKQGPKQIDEGSPPENVGSKEVGVLFKLLYHEAKEFSQQRGARLYKTAPCRSTLLS